MTGGPHGTHRGRVADPHGGAHWWRGHGPLGGGSHAAGAPRRRRVVLALVLLAAVAVVAAGVAVIIAGRDAGNADAASAGAPPTAPAPAGGGAAGGGAAGGGADSAALQARLDGVLAATPVRFAPAAVEPLSRSGLAPLAAALQAAPGVPVTVEGYTAPIGTDGTRSQELSRQRAEEVAGDLAALGVDPARLRTAGLGDTRPRATLDESRRVELRAG